MVCKTWSILAEKYLNPLCTNRFYPDRGTSACPICITPQAITSEVVPALTSPSCKRWSLPDGSQGSGLCTNKLFGEGLVGTCTVCITPVDTSVSGCGCTEPDILRAIHYLRVEYIGETALEDTCAANDPFGDFVLTGTCGGKTNDDQITIDTPASPEDVTCSEYATDVPQSSRVKKYSFVTVGSPVFVAGRRMQNIRLTYSRRTVTLSESSEPVYLQQTPHVFDGQIPWCIDESGKEVLLQRGTTESTDLPGDAEPTIKVTISTEPFE